VFGSWLLLLIQVCNSRRSGRLLDVLVGTDSDVVVGSRKTEVWRAEAAKMWVVGHRQARGGSRQTSDVSRQSSDVRHQRCGRWHELFSVSSGQAPAHWRPDDWGL